MFTITEGLANELALAGVDRARIRLLPNAVDPLLFQELPRSAELVQRHHLADCDLCLVYAGAMVTYEGLDDLIAAIGVLAERQLRVRLLLLGGGAAQGDLKALTAELGLGEQISFLGWVPPAMVPQYWALADAVVLPRKPFKVCMVVSPLKPFEAMSMGKPVILGDLPVMREIVRDGETGMLCRAGDPASLADTLERLARA